MNARYVFVVVTSLLLTLTHTSHAWNESGHLQIAAIAYGELSNDERAFADAILKKHVKYSAWKTEHDTYRANTPDDREVSLGFYVFTRAAVWPDEIRDYDKPETHAYWHFITYPLKSPSYSFRTELIPATNVVVGIKSPLISLRTNTTAARLAPSISRSSSILLGTSTSRTTVVRCLTVASRRRTATRAATGST